MRTTLLTAALLLLATGGAMAQRGPGRPGGQGSLDDANFGPTVARLTQLLDLTPDQVAKIEPLREHLLVATKAQRQQAIEARKALQQGRQSGVSADSMTALRQGLQGVMMSMMPARQEFHNQVRALLTPQQAELLDKRQEEMMGSMGERMAPGAGRGRRASP